LLGRAPCNRVPWEDGSLRLGLDHCDVPGVNFSNEGPYPACGAAQPLAVVGRLGGLTRITQKLNCSRADRKMTLSGTVDSRTILTKNVDCKQIKK